MLTDNNKSQEKEDLNDLEVGKETPGDIVGTVHLTAQESDQHPPEVPLRSWIMLAVSCFGVFMASVSTSALIIAFPTLLVDLNMSLAVTMWVLLVLLLVMGAVVATAGKLGDILGQATIYKIGYWCFIIGSLGAGFSSAKNKGYDLIACRVVIGFGAALLFTNSSAILTTAFAPYNKVGLSQGFFQLSSASGAVLGPLIGGALAETNWRWIFWYNVPAGGIFAVVASIVLHDHHVRGKDHKETHSVWDKLKNFDFIGSFFCSTGLILLLLAMVQAVSPDPTLSSTGGLTGLIVSGCACGLIFITDQFYAKDPLIPPNMFQNDIFTLTMIASTCMYFVRNSITYNMIFFLQGPFGQSPLQAGIYLVPYGCGNLVAGFASGMLTDKLGIKNMIMIGPLLTMLGMGLLASMHGNTSLGQVEGYLVIAGFGIGLFQSPNGTANMLSVPRERRGVAAAVGMLTMTFSMMVGIVLTFALVLHSMSADQLFTLFIYGAAGHDDIPVGNCVDALAIDYYILLPFAFVASMCGYLLPKDLQDRIKHVAIPTTAPPTIKQIGGEEEDDDDDKEVEMQHKQLEQQEDTYYEHILECDIPVDIHPHEEEDENEEDGDGAAQQTGGSGKQSFQLVNTSEPSVVV